MATTLLRTRPTRPTVRGQELVSWYFFRLSGVLLIILACGHIFITHYLNVPSFTNFEFVAVRYQGPVWRTFDWLLLVLALIHGLNGWRVINNEYIRNHGWRLLANSVVYSIAIVWIALGSITILTFDPNRPSLTTDLTIGNVLNGLLVVIAIGTYLSVVAIIFLAIQAFVSRRLPFVNYRGNPGQWAWLFHRAAGLGILFFLLIHILDIMLIGIGREVYNHSVEFYGNWFIVPLEVALVGAVLYHSLNGLRVILIDFWRQGVKYQRAMFYGALVLSILLTLPSLWVIVSAELSK